MFPLDHIGVAVPSLEAAIRGLGSLFPAAPTDVEEVAGQGVRVQFLPTGGTHLELLEPSAPDSPIARHLERRGAGLHHLAYRVPDLEATLRRLEGEGVRLVDRTPRPGAGGHLVAFLHPKSTGNVLIELIQDGGSTPAHDPDSSPP